MREQGKFQTDCVLGCTGVEPVITVTGDIAVDIDLNGFELDNTLNTATHPVVAASGTNRSTSGPTASMAPTTS